MTFLKRGLRSISWLMLFLPEGVYIFLLPSMMIVETFCTPLLNIRDNCSVWFFFTYCKDGKCFTFLFPFDKVFDFPLRCLVAPVEWPPVCFLLQPDRPFVCSVSSEAERSLPHHHRGCPAAAGSRRQTPKLQGGACHSHCHLIKLLKPSVYRIINLAVHLHDCFLK